ncbi:hypothetical protein COCNU_scaffold020044G000010 [Cocos nucifera]|nr:hypothetical protein [Cocos nucifera]
MIKAAEEKIKLVEAQAEVEKMKPTAEAKMKAIDKFRALSDFEAEIVEGSMVTYVDEFDAGKARAIRSFPKINVSRLNHHVFEDEAMEEDQTTQPIFDTKAPIEPATESTPKLTTIEPFAAEPTIEAEAKAMAEHNDQAPSEDI